LDQTGDGSITANGVGGVVAAITFQGSKVFSDRHSTGQHVQGDWQAV